MVQSTIVLTNRLCSADDELLTLAFPRNLVRIRFKTSQKCDAHPIVFR